MTKQTTIVVIGSLRVNSGILPHFIDYMGLFKLQEYCKARGGSRMISEGGSI